MKKGVTKRPPQTYLGQTKTIREWSRETGIPETRIHGRLRMGWPFEKAITQKDDARVIHGNYIR